jgi:exopolysaccharide biosynthesis polyprenyl glycosylphosphotransferase
MNRIDKINRYKYYYALTDFLVLSVSFVLTVYAMMIINDINLERLVTPVLPFVVFLFMLSILFIFDFNRLYTVDMIRSKTQQIFAVIKSLAAGAFYIFLITFLIMSVDLTEIGLLILAFTTVAFSLLYIIRVEVLRSVLLDEKIVDKKVLILGDGSEGKKIAEQLVANGKPEMEICGFLDNSHEAGDEIAEGITVIGKIEDLENVIESCRPEEIIISFDSLSYNEIFEVADKCNQLNLDTKIASKQFNVIPENFKTENYFGVPVVEASFKGTSGELKRVMDVFLSLAGLIFLAPLFLIIAVLIKLTSKGPVFYKQQRVGLNGEKFDFYKFRSMYMDDENDEKRKEMMLKFMKDNQVQGANTKVINKKRVTPIGSFLRKYSIDELPQLLNVVKGDMSLVGPRPSLPYEFENYEPWQRKRVDVIPGCTGVWQVSGRSQVSFNESILLDLFYINRMSVWLDIKLILKTIPVMIFSKGGE